MGILKWLMVVVLICSAFGCAGMNSTEQMALSGGAIGSAAGLGAAAIIGAPLIVGVAAGACRAS